MTCEYCSAPEKSVNRSRMADDLIRAMRAAGRSEEDITAIYNSGADPPCALDAYAVEAAERDHRDARFLMTVVGLFAAAGLALIALAF